MGSEIVLANGRRIATHPITDAGSTVQRHLQRVIVEPAGEVAVALAAYLRTSGASESGAADFSSSAGTFFVAPDEGEIYRIDSLVVQMRAPSGQTCDPGKYGHLTALTAGVLLRVWDEDDGLLLDITDGQSIKTNDDWAMLGETVLGARALTCRIRFPVPLRLEFGERLEVTLQENLSTLERHVFFALGAWETWRT